MWTKKRLLILVLVLLLINLFNLLNVINLTGTVIETTTGTAALCLNFPPTVTDIARQQTHHNLNFTYQVNATDNDGNAITYADNTSLFVINSTSGLINFTPTIGQRGNHSITITVTDNASDCPRSTNASFILEIINWAPVLNMNIPNQTWEMNIQLTGLNLNDYFYDPEGTSLNFTATAGSNIAITINSSGGVTFIPTANWYGLSWVIFTANDSWDTTNSNNVTLNVTRAAFCGDGACNNNETCSTCPGDCGACAGGSTGGGGGGGGGGAPKNVTVKNIIKKGQECNVEAECTEWLPESCAQGEKQTMSCISLEANCAVVERIYERDCLCQPRWECTIWLPENCANGYQQRSCVDLNHCQQQITLPLTRTCLPSLEPLPPREEQPGLIYLCSRQLKDWLNQYALYWILLIVVVMILLILAYLQRRRKERQQFFNEEENRTD